MTKEEYEQAVKKSRRRFAYVQICAAGSKRAIPLSRAKALKLVGHIPGDTQINAEWASDAQEFLLVG